MLWRWFAVVIVILAVAGMWHVTIPDRPVAVIVDAETLGCATPYPIGPLQTTPTATVPDDFVPVAAVTCDPYISDNVAADRTVSFYAPRWEGDFSRAVKMLNRSSAHKTWFPGSCGDNYSLAVLDQFWLVDDRGRATRPGHPSDSCGLPKPGGLAAIKELTPVGSTEHRIALSDDQIYELSHCQAGLPTSHNRYRGADVAVGGQRFLPILRHRIRRHIVYDGNLRRTSTRSRLCRVGHRGGIDDLRGPSYERGTIAHRRARRLSARHRRRIRADASVGRAVGVFPVALRHNAVDLPLGRVGPDVTADGTQSCQAPGN